MKLGVPAHEASIRLIAAFGGLYNEVTETTISFRKLELALLRHKRRQRWYNKLFNKKESKK